MFKWAFALCIMSFISMTTHSYSNTLGSLPLGSFALTGPAKTGSEKAATATAGAIACLSYGGYPFVQNGCLNANDLNQALSLSPNSIPPQNSLGQGAQYGKLWLDTSQSPPELRECRTLAGCSIYFNPSDWLNWGTVDTANNALNLSLNTLNVLNNASVGSLNVLANQFVSGQLAINTNSFKGKESINVGNDAFITILNNDLWITTNAYYDGTNWRQINTAYPSFAVNFNNYNAIPFETNTYGPMWWTAAAGSDPINSTFGTVNGWDLMYGSTNFKDFVIGGFGIELDGNGTLPYGRFLNNNYNSEGQRIGFVSNLFSSLSNVDNSADPIWYAGFFGDSYCIQRGAAGQTSAAGLSNLFCINNVGNASLSMGGLVVGSPSGGNEGSGTINAQAIYLNGVAVTNSGGSSGTVSTTDTVVSKTANYTMLSTDTDIDFNNNGALGTVDFLLPATSPGLHDCFSVMSAQALTVSAQVGSSIAVGTNISVSGGNVTNSVPYSTICLVAESASLWIAKTQVGTWTVQ
jgi:hypothetical protein